MDSRAWLKIVAGNWGKHGFGFGGISGNIAPDGGAGSIRKGFREKFRRYDGKSADWGKARFI